eukprot:scaffold284963_cov32-Tisochrysis_lutea.AAC.1
MGMRAACKSDWSKRGSICTRPPAWLDAIDAKPARVLRDVSQDATTALLGGNIASHAGRTAFCAMRSTSSGVILWASCATMFEMHCKAAIVASLVGFLAWALSTCPAALQTASCRWPSSGPALSRSAAARSTEARSLSSEGNWQLASLPMACIPSMMPEDARSRRAAMEKPKKSDRRE